MKFLRWLMGLILRIQTGKKPSGGWFIFLGALFWSLNAPLVKFLSLDPLLVCGLRSAIAGVALAPFIRPKQLNWNWWMVLYVGSYTALCISIIVALSMTASAIAIGMQYTAMIWLFLAGLVARIRFRWQTFLPVLLIFGGVVFFMSTGMSGGSNTGNLIALSEGVFFACMTVSSKKAAGTNPLGLTAVANLFTGLFVFLFLPPTFADLGTLSGQNWLVMLILGVVQIGLGYGFYNYGLKTVSPQKASIVALWEMILGPIWVALFLKEYPSLAVLAGFVIILAGMILDAVLNSSTPRAKRGKPGKDAPS